MSQLRICLSAQGAKNVSWPWLSPLAGWGCLTMASTGKFVDICISYLLIIRDCGLSTLCHSCRFACQQRLIKTFPGSGCLHSEDGVVWLWDQLVNLYIWLAISSCYSSMALAIWLIGRDGGLNTLCHSWVCLSAEGANNVFLPWLSLLLGLGSLTMASTGKFVYMAYHFILLWFNLFGLMDDRERWWFEHSMS